MGDRFSEGSSQVQSFYPRDKADVDFVVGQAYDISAFFDVAEVIFDALPPGREDRILGSLNRLLVDARAKINIIIDHLDDERRKLETPA